MDGNGGETPNPLNQPSTTPADAGQTTTAQPADPMARPMAQAPAEEAKPVKDKKKTGLIIGGIIALFVAVGCGVAAALLLLSPKVDPVTAAMQKLSSSEIRNIGVKGTIDVAIDNDDSPVSNVKVSLDGQASLSTKATSANVAVTATMKESGDSATANLSEVSTSDGDFFVKLENVVDAIEALTTTGVQDCAVDEEETDCVEVEESSESLAFAQEYSAILELFEDQWFRITADDLNSGGTVVDTSMVECAENFANDLSTNKNSISELYKKYPYISSSTEGLAIAKKNNPIYKIVIDGEKLTNFLNESIELPAMSNYLSCANVKAGTVTVEEINDVLAQMPDFYVEIDNNYDITRLYFVAKSEDESLTVTVDLDLSYPENVIITEPDDYQDLTTFIQKLMTAGGIEE